MLQILLNHLLPMKLKILVAIGISFLLSGCNLRSPEDKPQMDIYLLIGQSNMAGRAEISEPFRDTLQGVYLFTNDTLRPWEPAANPLNKYSTIRKRIEMQKMGPGYSFAKQLRAQIPDKEIGLVVNAKGGTSLFKWLPGGKFYNDAVARTLEAMQYGTLKGILWLQGEADTRKTDVYLDSLSYMISSFREDFSLPDLPFVASELSEAKPQRIPFNIMLKELPERVENTAVITSEGTTTIDSTHFDSESQRILGERFANQIIQMIDR